MPQSLDHIAMKVRNGNFGVPETLTRLTRTLIWYGEFLSTLMMQQIVSDIVAFCPQFSHSGCKAQRRVKHVSHRALVHGSKHA